MKNELRKIGKIKSSHGIKGEVFILIFSKDTSWVKHNLVLHLSKNNSDFKEYTILKFKIHKEGVIATLNDLKTRNESDLLIGTDIYIDISIFKSNSGESLYLIEIEGFTVFDQQLKNIGYIAGFSTNGLQDLLIIKDKKTDGLSSSVQAEYEIPFVKEFIVNIDYLNKILTTNLPEGLLDINKSDENKSDEN